MSITYANLFRAFITFVLASHVFFMYCLARVIEGTFGFDMGRFILAAGFSFAMLIPFIWAVAIPEIPEIYLKQVRGRRWWKRRCCPHCGYSVSQIPDDKCPECGGALKMPTGYQVSMHTVRVFVVINILAWIIGCTAGEFWIRNDERMFQQEIRAKTNSDVDVARARRWPNSNIQMRESDLP